MFSANPILPIPPTILGQAASKPPPSASNREVIGSASTATSCMSGGSPQHGQHMVSANEPWVSFRVSRRTHTTAAELRDVKRRKWQKTCTTGFARLLSDDERLGEGLTFLLQNHPSSPVSSCLLQLSCFRVCFASTSKSVLFHPKWLRNFIYGILLRHIGCLPCLSYLSASVFYF